MAIQPGTRLGPYEVLAAIGAGGMGEVYKARDTRLDRTVAIKVLPRHLADKPEVRERFEREAKTIASLNHPHICTLYDTGHQDGTAFLVMEYLEGETLATRLVKGPLPLDQVLRYAIEIADALDKAHRRGITHRDLKPGNIMLTKNGTKLLDFGLAKLREAAAPTESVSQMPTLSHSPTAQGTLLGTMQYMAPEQVEGNNDEVDARTDIFAFGAVVYEMATGKKAFEGKTNASIIGAILKDTPAPISSLQPMTPPALERIVKRCLAKDPNDRWQTARDLELELKAIAEGGSQVVAVTAAPASGIGALGRRPLIFGLGALLLVAVVTGLTVWLLRPSLPRAITRAVINLPPGQQLVVVDQKGVAISPDGSHLVYVATQGGSPPQLYLRAMDSLETRSLGDTDGAAAPFFSPDGQWIGFFASGKLKKVSTSGGTAVTLCDVPASLVVTGSWSSRGTIVFGAIGNPIQQVSEAGGTPQALTNLEQTDGGHILPEFLPGGNALLFGHGPGPGSGLAVYSMETGERRELIQGAVSSHYTPSGHLIYEQERNLMAVPFDARRLTITGAAVPVVEGVGWSPNSASGAQYSVSDTGSLAYVPFGGTPLRQLVWVSRNGTEQPVAAPARGYVNPRISPDGQRVGLGIEEGADTQVWVYDLGRGTLTRLTFQGTTNDVPVWTPDGKRVAYLSDQEGPQNLFWQLADGTGGAERLTTSATNEQPGSWSRDGRVLAFVHGGGNTGRDIWVLQVDERKAEVFLQTTFAEGAARFSPDGRYLAYVSNESGRPEIYVQPYPGAGGKWQISTEGGTEPVWNPNGRELFYRSGDKMMAVDVSTQPSFSPGTPRALFERHYRFTPFPQTIPTFDVSSDGQRFLMIKENEQVSTQINIVLNWFEELKQRMPAGTK